MALMTSKQTDMPKFTITGWSRVYTYCCHGNVMCYQSALDLLQSPNNMSFLRMVMIITVVTENTGLVLIGSLLSLTAGVPHSHLLQRWELHQPCNLSLNALPYEQLRTRVHCCGSKTFKGRVQWNTSPKGP